MERTMSPEAVSKLSQRATLEVDASRTIAVKRDVHEFEVTTDAATFAGAFRAVVTAADSTFGLIRVKRPAARMGKDFEIGERFQGCFSLEKAALAALDERPTAARWLAAGLGWSAAKRLVTWIEDALLSNYAEVREIVTEPDLARGEAFRLQYGYLDGTPIAGKSTFTIEPLTATTCRVRQIFEYQEVNSVALGTFQRFGLKYHDQVVHMEIAQAAARVGATVVGNTIPRAYAELSS